MKTRYGVRCVSARLCNRSGVSAASHPRTSETWIVARTSLVGREGWLGRVDGHRTNDGLSQLVPQAEMAAEAMPTNAPGRARWLWRQDSRPPDSPYGPRAT